MDDYKKLSAPQSTFTTKYKYNLKIKKLHTIIQITYKTNV